MEAHTCILSTKQAKHDKNSEFDSNLDHTVKSLSTRDTEWDHDLKTNKMGETINNLLEKNSILLRTTNETNRNCHLNYTLKCTVMFQGRAELDARRSNSKPIG